MVKSSVNATTATGKARRIIRCKKCEIFEKTRPKLSKYNAKGKTHSKGVEATSVETYDVTLNIKLEGTNANAIHRIRVRKLKISLSSL